MLKYQRQCGLYKYLVPFLMFLVKTSDKICINYLLAISGPKIKNKSFFVFQALQGNEVRGAEEENLVSLPFSCSVSFMFCLRSHICFF